MIETDDSSGEAKAQEPTHDAIGTNVAGVAQALPGEGLRPHELIPYRKVPWQHLPAARLNPVEYLMRAKVPVYVRIEEDEVALRYYWPKGGLSFLFASRFEGALKFLRLDNATLGRVAATCESSCRVFTEGGLAFVDDAGRAGAFMEPVDFESCIVVENAEEVIAKRPLDADYLTYIEKYAKTVRIREDDLWLLKRDEERILAGWVSERQSEDFPYPPGLSYVPAVYWMFQAAYRLNVLESIREDKDDHAPDGDGRSTVIQFLMMNAGEVFSKNRAKEAAKFVKKKVHRLIGGSDERIGDRITLGDLKEYLEPREVPKEDFISDGLRALMVIGDWWADNPVNRKDTFPKESPAQMARYLKSMGFGGTELPHLVASINGSTKWQGKPLNLHGGAKPGA